MADFASGNAGSYFSPNTTYPGSVPMKQALQQYFRDLMGGGAQQAGQLAASSAAQGPAEQYQGEMEAGTPFGSPAPGIGAYGSLMAGDTASRAAGLNATTGETSSAETGISNVAGEYSADIENSIQSQMAMNKAIQATKTTGIGAALGLGNAGNQILGFMYDPGNLSGAFGHSTGPLAFANPGLNGSPGGLASVGNIGSMFGGGGAGGGTGNTGSPASAYGFTPVQPGGEQAQNLAAASGDSWLNPNDIAGISGAADSTGLFSSLLGGLAAFF